MVNPIVIYLFVGIFSSAALLFVAVQFRKIAIFFVDDYKEAKKEINDNCQHQRFVQDKKEASTKVSQVANKPKKYHHYETKRTTGYKNICFDEFTGDYVDIAPVSDLLVKNGQLFFVRNIDNVCTHVLGLDKADKSKFQKVNSKDFYFRPVEITNRSNEKKVIDTDTAKEKQTIATANKDMESTNFDDFFITGKAVQKCFEWRKQDNTFRPKISEQTERKELKKAIESLAANNEIWSVERLAFSSKNNCIKINNKPTRTYNLVALEKIGCVMARGNCKKYQINEKGFFVEAGYLTNK